ncbi:hypothetical protein Ddye_030892 [Dipteronia dyeriana]|uniref:Uncharacterized protein n=1 Tax=Dipteronia dyeriana TaxID=168575 RepID=A0AAD9TIG9_9ROSI|nr:hypothetical protein Ddye_030892 [Dipteronia dyeriana]
MNVRVLKTKVAVARVRHESVTAGYVSSTNSGVFVDFFEGQHEDMREMLLGYDHDVAMSPPPPLRFFIFTTFLFFLFLFFFFFLASASNPPNPATIHLHDHYTRNNYRSCSSFTQKKSRSLCIQLQRIHHQLRQHRHSPPPPSLLDEIDPRYGVEKRLVPSGPNPLHN